MVKIRLVGGGYCGRIYKEAEEGVFWGGFLSYLSKEVFVGFVI